MEYIVSSNEFFLPEWNKIEQSKQKKKKIRKKLTEYQYFSFAILSGQIIINKYREECIKNLFTPIWIRQIE